MQFLTYYKRPIISLVLIITFFTVFQNCGNNPVAPPDKSVIEGKVVNLDTARPIAGVLVRSFSFANTAITGQDGIYNLEIELSDTTSKLVSLIFNKDGYFSDTLNVTIQTGIKTNVPDAQLVQKNNPVSGSSGGAANVELVAVEETSVFVKGSGGNETSNLTFVVSDSNGIPIDLQHQATVQFRIVAGPGGGEFVDPDSISTDANGRVITTLNSGNKPGTVQIQAAVSGTTIKSEPIPLTITGWLPDETHFTLARAQLNFPGFRFANLRDKMTVLIGDKFSNPVLPGTSVWFHTTGGVIQGSANTDTDGQATVDLISGLPLPTGVNFADLKVINSSTLPSYFQETGYALVTAETFNENNILIFAEAIVLFSGSALIQNVSLSTFNLAPDEFVDITFTVSDQNSNPLAATTIIRVSTNNGNVTGDNSVLLEDNLSRAATSFLVRLSNSRPAEIQGESTTVTINVTGPNGNATWNIFGIMKRS